jgi:hypothetical protein
MRDEWYDRGYSSVHEFGDGYSTMLRKRNSPVSTLVRHTGCTLE